MLSCVIYLNYCGKTNLAILILNLQLLLLLSSFKKVYGESIRNITKTYLLVASLFLEILHDLDDFALALLLLLTVTSSCSVS